MNTHLSGLTETLEPLTEPAIDATAYALTRCPWSPAWHAGHWIERHRLPCAVLLHGTLIALGWVSG